MAKNIQLSERLYADARARGDSKAEAARKAGSRSKSAVGLSRTGARLEARESVQRMIAEAEAAAREETHDDWAAAVKTCRKIMENPEESGATRLKAVDIFAKIGGHYAPEKREHTARITLQQLVEEIDAEDAQDG